MDPWVLMQKFSFKGKPLGTTLRERQQASRKCGCSWQCMPCAPKHLKTWCTMGIYGFPSLHFEQKPHCTAAWSQNNYAKNAGKTFRVYAKKNCQHAILASHSSKGGTARSSGSWMPWNRWWNAAQASDWVDMIWVADIVLALTILCLLYSPCHLAGLIPNEWPASLLSLVFTSSSAMWSSRRSDKLTSQLSQY